MIVIPIEIKSKKKARSIISSLGVSRQGVNILSSKSRAFALKIKGLKSWEANIIKQHLLSLGSDAAIPRDALVKDIAADIVIFGNLSQLNKLCRKLKNQPFALREASQQIATCLENISRGYFFFTAKDKRLLIKKPVICGIINVTDDSFSGDGLLHAGNFKGNIKDDVLKKAESMVKSGAKIIDIGGQSTRPFSRPISAAEEIKRVIPVIKVIRKKFPGILLSIDTYKYKVAKEAVEEGIDIINDITALRASSRIAQLIRDHKLGCILMHMKGVPQTMQINPAYGNVVEDIIEFFKERLEFAMKKGIKKEQIMIDPGIGFGKRVEDNFSIINRVSEFKVFGLPIFLGISRKSFIGKALNKDVGGRLAGTCSLGAIALVKGANVLRVHDVGEAVEAAKMADMINSN
ncbi:MAG: dihydropteroate synthase [Candidatus Omnitrophota bacterium]